MTTSLPIAKDARRWFAMAMVGLGVSLIIVDATIVNVAIPSIIRNLNINFTDAEWVNSIYSLVFAALLITVGRLGDLKGRKLLFLGGLVVFLSASALAGLAPTGRLLIAARLLQGVGAAMILPSTLSIVNATFVGRERIIAFAIWGSIIGGMAALGPLLGGWLTTNFSWRWAFLVNVPVGLLVFAGTLAWVRESRDDNAQQGLDLPGITTITIGMTALIFALIEGQRYGWWQPTRPFAIGTWTWPSASLSIIPVAFAIALIVLPTFILIQRHRTLSGKTTLIDLSLFQIKSFTFGNLTAAVVSMGEFGMIFVLPLFLQSVLAYSAFQTGVVLLALASGAFLASGLASPLSQRFGQRRVVSVGMGLEALSIFSIFVILRSTITGWVLVPSLLVYGMGVGLASALLTSVILIDVPRERSGQASGMQSTFRQVGSALGIAVLGTVLTISLGNETQNRLAHIPGLPPQAQAQLVALVKDTAGQALVSLRQQPHSESIVAAATAAVTQSTRWAALVAALFVLCGFAASWLLPAPTIGDAHAAPSETSRGAQPTKPAGNRT